MKCNIYNSYFLAFTNLSPFTIQSHPPGKKFLTRKNVALKEHGKELYQSENCWPKYIGKEEKPKIVLETGSTGTILCYTETLSVHVYMFCPDREHCPVPEPESQFTNGLSGSGTG